MDYLNITDEAVVKATGKNWQDWFKVLDNFHGKKKGHTESAKYLRTTFKLNAWWAQVITIRYEKEHGIWKRSGTKSNSWPHEVFIPPKSQISLTKQVFKASRSV